MSGHERAQGALARLSRWLAAYTAQSLPAPQSKASAAGPLIAIDGLGQPAWTPRDYSAFAREGFMQNPVVYRSVRLIAEAAAAVPLLLYDGEDEIAEHPLRTLLARPSPGRGGQELLEAWYGFLLVAGNAYFEAVAIGGGLKELHVLRPDRMKVVPGADGWPEAFEYSAAGRSVRFTGEAAPGVPRVLHVRLFHPVNDHYGFSPIEAAAAAVDIHNATSAWHKALLDNSARPSGVLVYGNGGHLTGDQFERLKRELADNFQGQRNAGRPLLLEGGLDWKAMSLSPRDMDFIEAKHAAARDIALAIGVPPMLLGIPGDNTYSNYQEANRSFWRQTVLPLVERTAGALAAWLGAAWGGGLSLKPDLDQVPALSADREALWSQLEKASFLTRDEKRAAVGYGPLGDGEGGGEGGGAAVKYSPDQPRDEIGRWTDGGGGAGSADGTRLAQLEGPRQYSVDLEAEEAAGGHALGYHVGKSDEYFLGVVKADRLRGLFITVARIAEGSFPSREAANDFVNQVIRENSTTVDLVASGQLQEARLNKRFGYVTGKEAFRSNADADPYIRNTYAVRVLIRYDKRSERGYRVHTAFPINQD